MGKSQETFSKKEKEKKRIKKRQDKQLKREERLANSNKGGSFEDMIAYVDENGHLTDTPPDPSKKVKIDAESIELGIPKKEEILEDPVKKGKVDFYNSEKGYGFIRENETNEKYFFHINGVIGGEILEDGEKITFELEKGLKGINAVKVERAKTVTEKPKADLEDKNTKSDDSVKDNDAPEAKAD